jgi:hypothetical protein
MVERVPADGLEAIDQPVLPGKPLTVYTVASELYSCWATLHSK